MKNVLSIVILFLTLHAPLKGAAQVPDTIYRPRKGWSHTAAFEVSVPVGTFSTSHIAGAGLEYAWSRHRYGWDLTPPHLLGFTFNAGGTYFLGKKEMVADNDFHFGGYIDLHALAGMIYNPYANVNLSLTAGPAMGIYKGNTDLGLGAKFSANYYFKDRLSIGPGVMYRKDQGVDALWSLMVRAAYSFRIKKTS